MTGQGKNQDHPFQAIRPLVRYVDETQAVLDTHIALATDPNPDPAHTNDLAEIRIAMTGPDGDRYEHRSMLPSLESGMFRFEIDDPKRWWPAGMGDQTLYELTVELIIDDQPIDTWQTSIGLTSVRPASRANGRTPTDSSTITPLPNRHHPNQPAVLLVNGQERSIHSVITLGPRDEGEVLPISGDSLVVVQGHYGSDRLYDAADRAGILVIQSVQTDDDPHSNPAIVDQINRLTAHPSLAGWSVNLSDHATDHLAHQIHLLDPTRSIFRSNPDMN